jgi:hypothetical protein
VELSWTLEQEIDGATETTMTVPGGAVQPCPREFGSGSSGTFSRLPMHEMHEGHLEIGCGSWEHCILTSLSELVDQREV